jgi:hypothetical protein
MLVRAFPLGLRGVRGEAPCRPLPISVRLQEFVTRSRRARSRVPIHPLQTRPARVSPIASGAQCDYVARRFAPLDDGHYVFTPSLQGGPLFFSPIMTLIDAGDAAARAADMV